MQGHRSAIGSLPETLDFDHGSSSSNPAINQQICWNTLRNPGEHGVADYILPPGDTGITYFNSAGHEVQNLSRWNLGEPSSSNRQNGVNHDEHIAEHEWPPSLGASTRVGLRLQERQYEPASVYSRNNDNVNVSTNQTANGPLISGADASPQNLNLNAGFAGHVDVNCQVMECPNAYKSTGLVNERMPSASSSSDPFGAPSSSGGYLVEESDSRPGCSLDGRRLSCKRKAFEGSTGQLSLSGSSRCFQHAESSGWQAVPARSNAVSGLNISTPSENLFDPSPSEQVNPRLGLGSRGGSSGSHPDLSMVGIAENSHRNFRVRINPSQQDSVPLNLVPTGTAFRNSNVSSSQQSSRFLPVNHSLNLRSELSADNANSQSQAAVTDVPALPQSVQSVRWNDGSRSGPGSSSSSVIPGERIAAPHEANLSNMSRHMMEHPLFVPATELRNLARNSINRTLAGGSLSIPGSGASTSRAGSSSGIQHSSTPTWVPHRNPSSQYPRRLSEYVRRQLMSSIGSDSGGSSSNYSPLRSDASAATQEAILSSGSNNRGNHHAYSRSALLMERQEAMLGFPYSLRTLAAASEGRSRLVSEIRNVLDLMRRGEGLRFEDVMILDQSGFFGVGDVHDRHRDMRLDVDNMSYEELLALEERIGNVSTGLSEETILNRLKQRKFLNIATEAELEEEPCCICQEEYNDGEDLGALECGHDFHTGCIKQWLMMKNLCPICKTTALRT